MGNPLARTEIGKFLLIHGTEYALTFGCPHVPLRFTLSCLTKAMPKWKECLSASPCYTFRLYDVQLEAVRNQEHESQLFVLAQEILRESGVVISSIIQDHRDIAHRIRFQSPFQKRQKRLRRIILVFLPNHLPCTVVHRRQQLDTAMFTSGFDHTLPSLFEPSALERLVVANHALIFMSSMSFDTSRNEYWKPYACSMYSAMIYRVQLNFAGKPTSADT